MKAKTYPKEGHKGIFFIHLFGSSEANKLKALFFVSLNRKFMDEPYRNIK
ncbi:MAG: hypothetical protein QT10_C0002G0025 [archaeon GW2011_AR19]|nr:MAG: hypothetical protein QT10_C0002G0025 [archaeon GW2011_AR19]